MLLVTSIPSNRSSPSSSFNYIVRSLNQLLTIFSQPSSSLPTSSFLLKSSVPTPSRFDISDHIERIGMLRAQTSSSDTSTFPQNIFQIQLCNLGSALQHSMNGQLYISRLCVCRWHASPTRSLGSMHFGHSHNECREFGGYFRSRTAVIHDSTIKTVYDLSTSSQSHHTPCHSCEHNWKAQLGVSARVVLAEPSRGCDLFPTNSSFSWSSRVGFCRDYHQ